MKPEIHPTAIIEPGAELADGVVVGAYAYVGGAARLGAGTRLHHHATVIGRTTMGAGNEVHPGSVLGGVPQDLKYQGEDTELIVGDQNTFRECVTVNIGTEGGGGKTVLGSQCLLMAYAHIAHDCILGNRVVVANAVQLAGHVRIEDGAVLSGSAAVHHFSTIGRLSFVGGLSGVRQDVPPFMLVEGNPARPRGLNLVGLKRNDVSDESLAALKKVYRLLYKEDHSRARAIECIEEDDALMSAPEVRELLDSFRRSMDGRHGRALEATRENGNGGMYKERKTGRLARQNED
ncbi:MAG: acyl-ACP--UDP-N-acetylglucosamine O-acyltransferase [Planctomycetota bacterium]